MRKLCGRFDAAAALKITITQNTHAYTLGSPAAGPRLARARRRTHTTCTWCCVCADPPPPPPESCENECPLAPRTRETTGAAALFLEARAKNKRARAAEFFDFSRLVPTPTLAAAAAEKHFTGDDAGAAR